MLRTNRSRTLSSQGTASPKHFARVFSNNVKKIDKLKLIKIVKPKIKNQSVRKDRNFKVNESLFTVWVCGAQRFDYCTGGWVLPAWHRVLLLRQIGLKIETCGNQAPPAESKQYGHLIQYGWQKFPNKLSVRRLPRFRFHSVELCCSYPRR